MLWHQCFKSIHFSHFATQNTSFAMPKNTIFIFIWTRGQNTKDKILYSIPVLNRAPLSWQGPSEPLSSLSYITVTLGQTPHRSSSPYLLLSGSFIFLHQRWFFPLCHHSFMAGSRPPNKPPSCFLFITSPLPSIWARDPSSALLP